MDALSTLNAVPERGARDKIEQLAGLSPAEIESRLASAQTKGA